MPMYVFEHTGVVRTESNTDAKGNAPGITVDFKRKYMIVAGKSSFAPDTVWITEAELSKPGTKVIKNLFLTPETLFGLLPLAIFFDNDVPQRVPTTRIEPYDETYRAYMARRDEFVGIITTDIADSTARVQAAMRLGRFFDDEVKRGFVRLEHFAENVDLFLESGYRIEVLIKGFASPLASQEYNMALTRRRIVSVLNYLRRYNNGMYESAIQQKHLGISVAPLGEAEAQSGISDNARDRNLSVFSVDASKERRAEIIEVRLAKIPKIQP
jgi:hypothetical protein